MIFEWHMCCFSLNLMTNKLIVFHNMVFRDETLVNNEIIIIKYHLINNWITKAYDSELTLKALKLITGWKSNENHSQRWKQISFQSDNRRTQLNDRLLLLWQSFRHLIWTYSYAESLVTKVLMKRNAIKLMNK